MPVFDCEANGLHPDRFYVLSYQDGEEVKSLHTHEEMKEWLLAQTELIGHNIICWDIPNLERVLGITITARKIDTLYLSWYLYPLRPRHGLEGWGDDFKVPKPEIKDWHTLSIAEYTHRCEEDVKINILLWKKQLTYLGKIYRTPNPSSLAIINYLSFKADCAREQERSGWKLDEEWCNTAYDTLLEEQEDRRQALADAMPKKVKTVVKTPPPKPYKKDGTLSVAGALWASLLADMCLPADHKEPVVVPLREEEGNPNSPEQLKDWLFSLGWEPMTFKFERADSGEERQIPQIKLPNSPDLCPSVVALSEEHPELLTLADYSVVKHRLGLLKGFLSSAREDGTLQARVQGLTNTLRFKHTEIVNLPGVVKPYGLEVRGCLVARDGYELVGSDMNSLEDNTKKHYMYPHDPEYVIEMSKKGFDPHLDLAKRAGAVSESDVEIFLANKDLEDLPKHVKSVVKSVSSVRKSYKVVNYSAVYGVGAPKLSRELRSTTAVAKQLLDSYWQRNWAVKKIAEDCEVRTVDGQMWLYNPVSKFYYTLRADKDRFSTLNQGTGVFCFDSWVREIRKVRPQLTATFHDEVILEVRKGKREEATALLRDAIQQVNDKLRLNVQLGVDVQFGHRYSDIH